ncbi:MAG: hypothetical protein ACRCYY_03810 [Trueperaceae bacterium]
MKAKLFLFDIDGTLLTCKGIGKKVLLAAGQHLFGDTFNVDLDTSGKLDNRTDLTLGLLTGNYGPAAKLKLKAVAIEPEWFSITAFGDEAVTRPDLVELAMKRYAELTRRKAVTSRSYRHW